MILRFALVLAMMLPSLAGTAGGAVAQTGPALSSAPPYEERLMRIAEILGSVQYLRTLCKADGETEWRDAMQALIDSETVTEPDRRERLIASYNRGFRAFAAVYSGCTEAARLAEDGYRREGATLATEIVARYGN